MSAQTIAATSRQCPLPREPDPDCSFCPRLATFRDSLRAAQPEWHNAPVPDFGALDARLLVVGLAPGLRGANRTGRPFTGDFAGVLLYEMLIEFGFAAGAYGASMDDGLRLVSCAITNAVRCVPPQNKPMPSEIESCRPFLAATIASLPDLCAIVALGRIAHESVVRAFGLKPAAFPFAHGAEHLLVATVSGDAPVNSSGAGLRTIPLFDSFHCSRYNTNTGVLTQDMFRAVFSKVRERL
ncbi:MAG: uracil-DNA glycosylase [Beijerinckiaceae bacterium]|nr:MAG: uracil-DNA glycosylase [Beijerinckiaceae bacterium]